MADQWRFQDRMAPGQAPSKRPRTEFEELGPTGPTYFQREEPRFEERDGRIAEPTAAIAYGSGLPGADITGVTAGHIGMTGQGPLNLGISTHDDMALMGQAHVFGIDKPAPIGVNGGRPDYLPRQDNPLSRAGPQVFLPPDASATLFVEGVPSDCTKREAAHIFRPFLGFKEVRLVRKDAKRPGGDQLLLCFVDFADPRYAAIAMEALQGYKFDETSRDSDSLRLQFARAPGPRGSGRGDFRVGRDDFSRGGGRPFRH